MSEFLLSPAARTDLFDIWDYYAAESLDPSVADRMVGELFDSFEKLAQSPRLGHFRRDLAAKPVRFWRVKNYLVIYQGEENSVEIVRVLHAARDVRAILGKSPE